MNGARTDEGQWAWQAKLAAGKHSLQNRHCRQTQPADSPPGTGLEEQTAHSWPALQQTTTAADDVGLSLRAGRWGCAVVLALKKAGSDLPTVPTPPIAFACHCPYPLP